MFSVVGIEFQLCNMACVFEYLCVGKFHATVLCNALCSHDYGDNILQISGSEVIKLSVFTSTLDNIICPYCLHGVITCCIVLHHTLLVCITNVVLSRCHYDVLCR